MHVLLLMRGFLAGRVEEYGNILSVSYSEIILVYASVSETSDLSADLRRGPRDEGLQSGFEIVLQIL